MAQAAHVRVGQVWTDGAGVPFAVLTPLEADGRFTVRNQRTGRTVRKGPRALRDLVQDSAPAAGAPAAFTPPLAPQPPQRRRPPPRRFTPGQIAAGFGGGASQPFRPTVAPSSADLGYAAQGFEHGGPPPLMRPPLPPAPEPMRHAPPMRSGWPSQPQQLESPQYGVAPSALVAFVVEQLLQMPPEHAASPSMVSRAIGHALAAWKSRPQQW